MITKRVQYRYDSVRNKIGVTDADGGLHTYMYDLDRRLTGVINPLKGWALKVWALKVSGTFDCHSDRKWFLTPLFSLTPPVGERPQIHLPLDIQGTFLQTSRCELAKPDSRQSAPSRVAGRFLRRMAWLKSH